MGRAWNCLRPSREAWFGGKAKIAAEVWRRFGDVPNFCEPFYGSGAVLLGRPHWHQGTTETVNDLDGLVSNFWRAVAADPEAVAYHADWPVNECDLTARHLWLVGQKESLQARLEGDPDYYDAKIAGWWCWGLCCWIGSGWCSGKGPWQSVNGQLVKTSEGNGVNRQRVHLGNAGQGINRKRVRLGGFGEVGVNATDGIYEMMAALSERLRRVRVCCGDWTRVCGPTPTFKHGLTGVFLDPPYSHEVRDNTLYRVESGTVAADVRQWCIENGDNPLLRIALCGYDNEGHDMPASWAVYRWKASGGYASYGDDNTNAERECIWFSPACLSHEQGRLM